MTASLSSLIRLGFSCAGNLPETEQGFREVQCREPALRDIFLDDLPRLMQCREVPACRQDDLLAATIRAYRRGPAGLWAPILLSMLGPALVRAAARLQVQPPAVDDEDIDQQIVMEALRAAAEMPLPDECRFVQRRLVLLASKRLRRWLERERRRQTSQESFEVMTEERP
jgi:hypothetical protein